MMRVNKNEYKQAICIFDKQQCYAKYDISSLYSSKDNDMIAYVKKNTIC